MEMIHIRQFEARYHLPPSMMERRGKLDHALDQVLDQGLSLALQHYGYTPEEQICIRKIVIPVRLRTSGATADLVAAWSTALAEHLHQAIKARDHSQVVRYPSRLAALIDCAVGLAEGDAGRSWAWRQLGFTRRPDGGVPRAAVRDLLAWLLGEARMIVPLVAHLAHIRRLHRLAPLGAPDAWQTLAAAALSLHGVPVPAALLAAPATALEPSPDSSSVLETAARRVTRSSPLGPAVAGRGVARCQSAMGTRVYAAFAVLSAEPDLLGRFQAPAGRLLDLVAAALETPVRPIDGTPAPSGPPPAERARPAPRTSAVTPTEEGLGTALRHPTAIPSPQDHRLQQETGMHRAAGSPGSRDGRVPVKYRRTRPDQAPGQIGSDSPSLVPSPSLPSNRSLTTAATPLDAPETDGTLPADYRWTGFTNFGGLLFLAPQVKRLGIVDTIQTNPLLAARPLRWVLHRLALDLLPISARNPAALAFCGLQPGDDPPGMDEPALVRSETLLFEQWRKRLVATLYDDLGWWRMSASHLLQRLCGRNARIVAEQGWIEAFFALGDVCLDIRKAGLDLDPGFLPWLGVVIRFNYE